MSKSSSTARTGSLVGLLFVALVIGVAGCGSAGGGKESLKVAVTTPSWNAGFATFLLSQQEDYFADEGLDVEFTLPPSGTQAAQQTIAGNADVALVTPEPVIIGATKKTDLTYFASYYGDWIYELASVPGSGIDAVADLAGKRIGVTNASSSGATFARVAMKMAGLDPDKAKFVPIGVGSQQINAIRDGKVDALALWDTQYQIVRNAGLSINELPVKSMGSMFGGGFASRQSRLDADPELFTKFGRAMAKGVVYAQANPEAAIKAMWRSEPDTAPGKGVSRKKALAQQVKVLQIRLAGLGIQKGSKEWGTIERDRMKRSVDFAKRAGLVKKRVDTDKIVDTGLLKDINKFSHSKVLKKAKATK